MIILNKKIVRTTSNLKVIISGSLIFTKNLLIYIYKIYIKINRVRLLKNIVYILLKYLYIIIIKSGLINST
ncbi:hypothetical protein FDC27_04305 [Clostridium botulinum]|nr:hypothetical protein [Clostridium botulinum]